MPDLGDELAMLLWRHRKGMHYASRHLGDGHVAESQCECGEWYPSYAYETHVADALRDAGYRKEWR